MSLLVRLGHFQQLLLNYWCLNLLVSYSFDHDNNGTWDTRCHAEEEECHKVTSTQEKVKFVTGV